jgi:hypothetical protein
MSLIILPTFDLVTECLPYDSLFHFLKDGVKDVIKESVVSRSFYAKQHVSSHIPGGSGLIGAILSEYDDYVARHEDLLTALTGEYREDPLADYVETMAKLEFMVMSIEQMVSDMMQLLIHSRLYEVSHASWRGRDLYAKIHLLGD